MKCRFLVFSLVFPSEKTFREAARSQNLLTDTHFLLFSLYLITSLLRYENNITKERKWYLTSVCTYTHMRSVHPSTHPCNTCNQSNKWSSFILQIEHKVQNVNRVKLNLNPLQISWSQCLPTSADSLQHIPLVNLTQGILFKLLLSQSHGSVLFVTFEFLFCFQ